MQSRLVEHYSEGTSDSGVFSFRNHKEASAHMICQIRNATGQIKEQRKCLVFDGLVDWMTFLGFPPPPVVLASSLQLCDALLLSISGTGLSNL